MLIPVLLKYILYVGYQEVYGFPYKFPPAMKRKEKRKDKDSHVTFAEKPIFLN
jgi:hypothetical protein